MQYSNAYRTTRWLIILTAAIFGLISCQGKDSAVTGKQLLIGKNIIATWQEEVNNTEEEILIATYKITSETALKALVAAHHRGVEVRLILDGKNAQNEKSLAIFAVKEGIEVLFWPSDYQGKLHTKFYIFDQKTVIFGSFNLTESAEKTNTELLYRIDDVEKIRAFTDEWQRLYEMSLPVNP